MRQHERRSTVSTNSAVDTRGKCRIAPGVFAALVILSGCGGDPGVDTGGDSVGGHDRFFAQLATLCGRAFTGEATLIASPGFEDGMIMHVRRCSDDEIQIPLHAGEDRSRTWIVTRTEDGLRLKHDHRHEDGSEDEVTQYGGDTADEGTATTQSFPADAFTAELLPEASGNVWSMTLEPGERFVYHLSRDGEPRATFEFDLTREVEPPPAAWGYEGT